MKRILLAFASVLALLVPCLGQSASGGQQFIFQVKNNGTIVYTRTSYGFLNCDGTTITCTGANGGVTFTAVGAPPTGLATGDLTGSYPNPTVSKIGGAATAGYTVKCDGSTCPLAEPGIATNPQAATTPYTILASDKGKLVTHSKATAVAVTLPQCGVGSFDSLFYYWEKNLGAGTVTITTSGANFDNGGVTQALLTNQTGLFTCDGTSWHEHVYSPKTSDGTLATAAFPASGVSAGACGDSTHFCIPTFDATGRATGTSTQSVSSGNNTICSTANTTKTLTGVTDNVFSCSVPGGTIAVGHCVVMEVYYAHTTGTGSTNYGVAFGATSVTVLSASTSPSKQYARASVCNYTDTSHQELLAAPVLLNSSVQAIQQATPAETTSGAINFNLTAVGTTNDVITLYKGSVVYQ